MSYEETDESWEKEEEGGLPIPDFLLDPLGVARRRWIYMILCLVLGLAVTTAAYLTWVPTYWAGATILITSQKIPESFVQSTVREDTLDNLNAMLGKVLSVEPLSKLVEDLDLFPKERDTVPLIDLVNRVRSRVGAQPQRGGRSSRRDTAIIYEISYTSSNPDETASVANALAELFVEASLDRRNVQAQNTTTFLREELGRDEAELREQSRLVADFRREHRGQLPSELRTNLNKLDMLANRRDSIELQIADKESRILTLTTRSGDGPMSEGETLLAELRRELARESAVHTDEHPNVIALRDRIARLERNEGGPGALPAAQRALVAAERRDIEHLRGLAIQIDAEMAQLNLQIDNTPAVEEELAALEQKERVLREDYLESLRKVEAAELAESLESARQGGQVSILDEARRPSRPAQPRWFVAVAGIILSAGLAVGIAVLLEFIDPVIVSSRQIGKLSDGGRVLGSLPDLA